MRLIISRRLLILQKQFFWLKINSAAKVTIGHEVETNYDAISCVVNDSPFPRAQTDTYNT